VSPNPAKDLITADFTTADAGFVWFLLQDTSGKVVKTWHAEMPAKGTFETEFDVSDYAAGSYYFTLSSGKFLRTISLVIK
ncbi:MAG: T9SS type A sorting domain-containing protein, partial [Saprospiraceae bacterium]|nr:T9SS type A sorting domain-containing protein [Saprospiraceae bacterium]